MVVSPVILIKKEIGEDFNKQMLACAKKAFNNGIMAFCVHSDSDSTRDNHVFDNKINPSFDLIIKSEDNLICKNLVAVVPVQMSESWMLADKQLLKDEIGTTKSDAELGLNRFPESIADPKSAIEGAIRIARQDLVKRRRHELKISELYQPIGQKIEMEKLELLPSFLKFKESVRTAYRRLNYLQ